MAPPPIAPGRGRLAHAAWTAVTSAGLTTALVAGVAVAPPSRRNEGISAETAWSFGVPSWIAAVALLALVVAVPVPARHRVAATHAGQVVAIVVGLLLSAVLAWRLVVGAGDLPDDAQIAVLRDVAAEAATAFGLGDAVVTPVLHAYNSTFRLDVGGASFAMRILVGSSSTPEHIAAQQSWQLALASQTDVLVPVPLPTLDGAWWTGVDSAAFGRTAVATVAGWLDGTAIDEGLDVGAARMLGEAMARMHVHAATWTPPPGASMPVYDDVLFGARDAIALVDDLPADARRVLREARLRSQEALARLHAADLVRPLHADLHSGNVLRSASGIQILDFDDAGLGVPALDLAISRFYADAREVQAAIAEGYAAVTALPDASDADLQAVAAGRQLLLANDLLTSTSAALRAEADEYLRVAVRRLEAWLDSGVFSRAVA